MAEQGGRPEWVRSEATTDSAPPSWVYLCWAVALLTGGLLLFAFEPDVPPWLAEFLFEPRYSLLGCAGLMIIYRFLANLWHGWWGRRGV